MSRHAVGALAAGTGLRLTGVGKRFGETLAVAGLDLSMPPHSRVGIVGPSGCGKSTILSMICGLTEPDTGTIDVLGATQAHARLDHCAWMPQRDLLLPWRSVLANARVPLENRGMKRGEASARVRPLLERFGLAEFADHRPAQLSGGMRQRVSFLRTLVADKPVLLLDEPFGALDSITRADLQDWLRTMLDGEPRTVVLVTHDVEEALLLCDRVVVMSARPGRVVASVDVTTAPVPAAGAAGDDGTTGNPIDSAGGSTAIHPIDPADTAITDVAGNGTIAGTAGTAGISQSGGGAAPGRPSRRQRLADPAFIELRDVVLGHLEAAR